MDQFGKTISLVKKRVGLRNLIIMAVLIISLPLVVYVSGQETQTQQHASGFNMYSVDASAPAPTYVALVDSFSGNTLDTSKWSIFGNHAGISSTANVHEGNTFLSMKGKNGWGQVGIKTLTKYDRGAGGNLTIQVNATTPNCNVNSFGIGYGDGDYTTYNYNLTKNSLTSADTYLVAQTAKGLSLIYFKAPAGGMPLQIVTQTVPSTIYTCHPNVPVSLQLVAYQTGGASLYVNGSLTPAVSVPGGTFSQTYVNLQTYDSNTMVTFTDLSLSGTTKQILMQSTIPTPTQPISCTPNTANSCSAGMSCQPQQFGCSQSGTGIHCGAIGIRYVCLPIATPTPAVVKITPVSSGCYNVCTAVNCTTGSGFCPPDQCRLYCPGVTATVKLSPTPTPPFLKTCTSNTDCLSTQICTYPGGANPTSGQQRVMYCFNKNAIPE